jgi:hypothetical protein
VSSLSSAHAPPSSSPWGRGRLGLWLLLLGGLVHGGVITGSVWDRVKNAGHGRDFASYYYAVQVAADGGDPYDTRLLSKQARQDGTRRGVHPFFYPPPYLLTMAWALPLDLKGAYHLWYWLDSLFLLASLLALWRWMPGPWMAGGIGVALATFTPIWDTHWMGQANLAVLALVAWGLLLAETRAGRNSHLLGGALVGLACMMKMSPGLLVAWWMIRRRWTAAAAACGSALLLSLATLPLLGFGGQLRFYTEVLPSFASGEYHGLSVPITLYGNHSIPNLFVQLVAALGEPVQGGAMQPLARALSSLGNGVLMAGALVLLRRERDGLFAAGAAGCLVVLMLLVPPYTYEHHMALMLIPLGACMGGLQAGHLGRRWLVGIIPSYALLAWQLQDMKRFARGLPDGLQWWLQEGKFAAALFLGIACLVLARRGQAAAGAPTTQPSVPGPTLAAERH